MRFFLGVIVSIFLTGCASMESLDNFHDQIIWEDGINRNEAAVIAKKWLTESKYAGDFQIFGPISSKQDNEWQITFLYKSLDYYEKVLDVFVDFKTGEVKNTVIRHRSSPNINRE
jgi:hypothetical protein